MLVWIHVLILTAGLLSISSATIIRRTDAPAVLSDVSPKILQTHCRADGIF